MKKLVAITWLALGLGLWTASVSAQEPYPVAVTDQTPTQPLANPVPASFQPRYISGFGLDDAFTVFFEDRDNGGRILYNQTTAGPLGFAPTSTATNVVDTHFLVKDWPVTIGSIPYAYRGWGAVGNNPDHHFYVSNNLITWTLVSTFTVTNTASFTGARGSVYYGFHDVIQLNGTYYAFGESNAGQTMIVSSTAGTDGWFAFDSVGGTVAADGPLHLPESGTPSGSFVPLADNRGYGKVHVRGNDSGFYLAINMAAKPGLPPADLEAAFINPANWTWNDGSTGLTTTMVFSATGERDLRECWVVPSSDPDADWMVIYDADFGGAEGKALGYMGVVPLRPVHHFAFATIGDQVETRPFTITVTAEDAYGHTVVSHTAPVTLTDSTGTISPTVSAFFVNGVLTQTVVITTGQPGVVITATHSTSPAVTGASDPFDVQALRVQNLDTGERFLTIQEAIDDVDTLDTHTISASVGLYDEQVTINKNLTLRGSGPGQTVLQGSGSGNGLTIWSGSNGVTITGLTVTSYTGGIRLGENASAVITNVLIADTELISNTSDGLYSNARGLVDLTLQRVNASFNGLVSGYRRGVFLQNSAATRENITIRDGVFDNNGLVGIDVNLGTVSGLTITNNVVRNNGDSGIGVYRPTSAWVHSNTVTNNGRFGIEIKNPAGDGTLSGPNRIVVMENTVSRDVVATDSRDHGGIVVIRRDVLGTWPDQPFGTVIVSNTVSGYVRAPSGSIGDGIGIAVAGLTHMVQGNVVFGNNVGIQVQGGNPSNPAGSSDQSAPDDYFNRDNARRVGALLDGNDVSANDVGIRVVVGTVTNTLLMNNNAITGNVTAGVVFTGTGSLTATLGGAPANQNVFLNNGWGGNAHISVTLAYTNPGILAYHNDWGVTDLAAIEDTIHHQADDPALGEVRYYGIALTADGSTPMADGASYATVTATLTGLLDPTGNVVSFTTDLGVLGVVTGSADADGTVTTIITSTTGGSATIIGTAGMAGDNPMSDTTQVTFAPLTLDHFYFDAIPDQTAGVGFPVTVSARDATDLVLSGFNGWAALSDATTTLVPTATIQFHDGVWSGTVTITQATVGDVITATYLHDANKNGASNAFDVAHDTATVVTLSPASQTITSGQSITYTVWATDTWDNGWDATAEAAFEVEGGAGGSWAGNAYASQFAGTWTVTATVDGVYGTASLIVVPSGTAGVHISPTVVAVEEGGITAVYSVSLNSRPADAVIITIATDGQTTVAPTSLTFDTANWDTAQPVTVTAVDDDEVEGTHSSTISHIAASADSYYDGIVIDHVVALVTDDDAVPVLPLVQFSSAVYSVKETAGAATITVTLGATSTVPVTVTYATSGGTATAGSDYAAVSDTLRFDVGQTSRTFTVPVLSDVLPESNETVNLVLSDPVNATLGIYEAVLTLVDSALYLPVVARNYAQ